MRTLPISSFWVKVVMSVTGLIFAVFVLVHMIGNLKVFAGPNHFDAYARWLRVILEPLFPHEGVLWLVRVVLIVSLVLHVAGALVLGVRARRARGHFPRRSLPLRSFAARTMLATGVGLLGFVVFHVFDLTFGIQPVAPVPFEAGSPYANLVASFKRPAVASFYMLAMLFLALHLAHGLWTAVHDLGVTGPRLRRFALGTSGVLAIAITLGNIGIPLAVLLGIVR
ncbi:MAG TPA: succinate dehydrogenase cytochrome b subunit [Labilithrix sp.]|nr:succinate dehydrogenase cytochrome b subunit [Labilithrix sp.]